MSTPYPKNQRNPEGEVYRPGKPYGLMMEHEVYKLRREEREEEDYYYSSGSKRVRRDRDWDESSCGKRRDWDGDSRYGRNGDDFRDGRNWASRRYEADRRSGDGRSSWWGIDSDKELRNSWELHKAKNKIEKLEKENKSLKAQLFDAKEQITELKTSGKEENWKKTCYMMMNNFRTVGSLNEKVFREFMEPVDEEEVYKFLYKLGGDDATDCGEGFITTGNRKLGLREMEEWGKASVLNLANFMAMALKWANIVTRE